MSVPGNDDVLRQIHRNRSDTSARYHDHPSTESIRNRRRGQTIRADVLMRQIASMGRGAEAAKTEHIASVLASVVDDVFARHCRVAGFRNRCLTIHVDDARRAYETRVQWNLAIRDCLLGDPKIGMVSRIVFAHGTEGVEIPLNVHNESDDHLSK